MKNLLVRLLKNRIKFLAKLYYFLTRPDKAKGNYIPASGKVLGVEELHNMIDASLDMWLTTGRFNDEFEEKFAKYLDVKHAITTNSGSSANLLAISTLTSYKLGKKRLKKGDEIITTACAFPTTVNPIIQNGLIPVFIDCEIGTYNIDTTKIEDAITEKTKAIFVAHTLGNPFNIDKVLEICKKHDLWLIEDSCDALGAEFNAQKAGTIGHIGTFSFYPAHHITMGEGGAVVTNDDKLDKIIRSFRDWGRDCHCAPGQDNACKNRFNQQLGNLPKGYDHKYTYSHIGFNLKITDWQAAIGVAQLEKLDGFLAKREENAEYLMKKLEDLSEYLIFPIIEEGAKPSWFGFLISVKPNDKFNKQELVEYLEENGVGTRQLFAGNILRQPMMSENKVLIKINGSDVIISKNLSEENYAALPNTEFIMNNTFWVGIYPALEKAQLDKTSDLIHSFIKGKIGA